ncbi:response regulator [Histidinibacterium aquaticum]|uniref:Response regulatory domain-containing protein n=1 Tax=Histidinibacterium aquaticum TaxID=2613962 RepID=A0A5J5GCR8_9RHOB|nr:hypothetical protein [Histidinibacterium aquaticum]KAA9005602.1 hypothetical protein F3S47_17000 [Histidinibacterium aquaticum]
MTDRQTAANQYRRQPLRLMLIEDRTISAIDIETKIEDLGHCVVDVASHMSQAEDRLARSSGRIDGVVLNPRLVGRSASSLARSLARRGVPYVLLTDLPEDETRREGFRGPRVAPFAPREAVRTALDDLGRRCPRRSMLPQARPELA